MFEVLLTVKIVNIEMIVNAFKNSWKDDLSKKSVSQKNTSVLRQGFYLNFLVRYMFYFIKLSSSKQIFLKQELHWSKDNAAPKKTKNRFGHLADSVCEHCKKNKIK